MGPGARLPRLPALCAAKRRWRLPEQEDPLVHQEDRSAAEGAWNQNYRSVAGWNKEVLAVLDDQSTRGQVLKLTEEEARARFPNLVVASQGANRKDKPDGTVSACVLFDGTNGVEVNKRTRIRDQETAPIAADLKRVMREKARVRERTFALSADVKEAHKQVKVAPATGTFSVARCSRAAASA